MRHGRILMGVLSTAMLLASSVEAEDITLTTYYPSPRGVYQELQTTGNTMLAVNGGRVGIGPIQTPLEKLHVASGKMSFATPLCPFSNADPTNCSAPAYFEPLSGLYFDPPGPTGGRYYLMRLNIGQTGNAGDMLEDRIQIGANDETDLGNPFAPATRNYIVLHNNGNVGIGTIAPQAKLTIKSDADFLGTLIGTIGFGSPGRDMFYDGGSDHYFVMIHKTLLPNRKASFCWRDQDMQLLSVLNPETAPANPASSRGRVVVGGPRYGTTGTEKFVIQNGKVEFVSNPQLPNVGILFGGPANNYDYAVSRMAIGTPNERLALRANNQELVTLHSNGNVGIRQPTPTEQLEVGGNALVTGQLTAQRLRSNGNAHIVGNLTVTGNLTAAGKSFLIPHPLDPGHRVLVHMALEGPEIGVYYRGEGWLADGRTTIRLPDYFEALTRPEDRTVLLTPIFEGDEPVSMLMASQVIGGAFLVRAMDDRNPAQRFSWEVKAVRRDVPPLVVEAAKPSEQTEL